MRILETRDITIREDLRVETRDDGLNRIWRGAGLVCDDSPEQHAVAVKYAIAAAPLAGKSVAWIGGGLCVGPRLFAIADCTQTVYEIEPALFEFCPSGVTFIGGDWRDTITGKFDVIVYDLGGDTPKEELAKFLNLGGKILP